MELSPTTQKYILHWGEMGTRWGVNRSVAQIHALLFLANEALTAEDIAASLNVARSNVSNSLKELQSWGLVRITHVLKDRRDHFVALQDVWAIFRVIMEERKRREIDPTLTVLRECAIEGEQDAAIAPETLARMGEVLAFLEMLSSTYSDYKNLPPATLQHMLSMGGKVAKFLSPEDKPGKPGKPDKPDKPNKPNKPGNA
ncbi:MULTISPECIES: MarR family transcriptional regulator [unclassified Janthinobacterium]|uniref:GbsR/MarR family transcriptional regulator n=1 Tax=unclassified Janthinobacterium TaxID=2610881 RepID=UPI002475BBA5|nr:MarR family transcriptional regulator [Janthinobacterium sp. CG_23.4]MDH6159439.1 DNA-binding transcriptional regulator GbsR (MarR family) [Janthinobacterium sp. CG_23.4]